LRPLRHRLSHKKMIMSADTLSHCRGFGLAARLG
jgi:hypothetical protein